MERRSKPESSVASPEGTRLFQPVGRTSSPIMTKGER